MPWQGKHWKSLPQRVNKEDWVIVIDQQLDSTCQVVGLFMQIVIKSIIYSPNIVCPFFSAFHHSLSPSERLSRGCSLKDKWVFPCDVYSKEQENVLLDHSYVPLAIWLLSISTRLGWALGLAPSNYPSCWIFCIMKPHQVMTFELTQNSMLPSL